ncbi:MAG: cytochrome c3 family protein [Planctomycetota bacterium]|nr:cytochrome c3 family protein [Planctomycetota bacterium]
MAVPDGLPLVAGRITCVTCHDNSTTELHRQARLDGTDLLRMPASGGSLCEQCHDAMSPRRVDRHALMLEQAHLRWPGDFGEDGAASSADAPGSLFDSHSERCLSCHDGSVASDVGHDTPGFVIGDGRSLGFPAGHPIGVEYPRRASSRSGSPLKPPGMLDGRIRLYNDRVGCLTCHSLYASERGQLVLPNTGSALCLSCHEY